MKQLLLFILLLFTSFEVIAGSFVDKIAATGRWSVAVEGGLNMYDGDLNPNPYLRIDGFVKSPNLDFSIEYNMHPFFSVGWRFGGMYMEQEDVNEFFQTGLIHTTPFVSVDLLGVLAGKKNPKWSFNVVPGLGFSAMYRPRYYTTRTPTPPLPVDAVVFSEVLVYAPLTFAAEYNVSKKSTVSLNFRHVFTNTDHFESSHRGDYNDAWKTVSVTYRYKFLTKEKNHFRDANIPRKEDPAILLINQLQQDYMQLADRVEKLEGKVDRVDQRVEKLEGILADDGPDTDQDGVPDVRDLEPNTTIGNAVDFWGRTIGFSKDVGAAISSVYFDFDRVDLDKIARITLVDVARKMHEDESLLLEIRGYTDHIGANAYNLKLSQRRADSVKNELVKVHQIAPERIIANGKGKLSDPPVKNIGNRRCDFFFSK